jgi:hypothetical protein
MARLPETFDPTRPTNKVEAAADYAGVSRGLAYQAARSGQWPAMRVGSRLLILTRPFLKMLEGDPTDELQNGA